ncbi:MAG: carboxypeptidase-like regulatory domain-containing protein, partial [Candidatus Anammoxibacter sp.]
TDENGNYKIENVPAGTYKIVAWQEALGKQGTKKQPIEVVVVDGQETTMNFDFKPRKSRKKKSS